MPAGTSWGVPVRAGRSVNLIAERPGFDRTAPHVVIGAHLDTVPQAPGAEDNASGVAVLLELAALHQQQGHWPEAMLALHDAAERFRDTPEEGRVAMTHADVLLARGEAGDASAALAVLASVRPSQTYYLQVSGRAGAA